MNNLKKIEIWPVEDNSKLFFVRYELNDGYMGGGKYSHSGALNRVSELLAENYLGGPVMPTDLIKDEADG